MCTNPFYIKQHADITGQTHSYVPVPCRHCSECLQQKRNIYFNRLVALSESGEFFTYFVTLTYDEANVTHAFGDCLSLWYRDIQLFFKRLRKKAKIKYVLCGEYGSNTGRPHYHMILFSDIPLNKRLVSETWNNGFIDIEKLQGIGGLSYICKYITKPVQYPAHLASRFGLTKKEWLEMSITQQRYTMKDFGLVPQFVRCSAGLDSLVGDLQIIEFISIKIKDFFDYVNYNLPYGTCKKFSQPLPIFLGSDFEAFQEKIMSVGELVDFVETFHRFSLHGKIDMYLPMAQLCDCLCRKDFIKTPLILKNLSRFIQGFKDWTLYNAVIQYTTPQEAERVVCQSHMIELNERSKKQRRKKMRLYEELIRKDMF